MSADNSRDSKARAQLIQDRLLAETGGSEAYQQNYARKHAFFTKRLSESTRPAVQSFYKIALAYLNIPLNAEPPTDKETQQRCAALFQALQGNYDQFDPQDMYHIRMTVGILLDMRTSVFDSAVKTGRRAPTELEAQKFSSKMFSVLFKEVRSHQLFQVVHEYGLVNELGAVIKRGDIPRDISFAYSLWKKANSDFLAACEARHKPGVELEEKAQEALNGLNQSMKDLAKLVGPDSTIGKMFPVIASEQLQAAIDKQNPPDPSTHEGALQQVPMSPLGRTLKDFYLEKTPTWKQRMMGSDNPEVAKIYQRILLATPGQEITPTITLSESEKQKFATNKIASIIKSSVDCFDSMTDQDRGEIGAFIIQVMDAISQRNAHITGEFYSVCDPKSLFRAIHLFGFENSFDRMVLKGFVTPHIINSYQDWKRQGKNKRFIAECAKRNHLMYESTAPSGFIPRVAPEERTSFLSHMIASGRDKSVINGDLTSEENLLWEERNKASDKFASRFCEITLLGMWIEDINTPDHSLRKGVTEVLKQIEVSKREYSLFKTGNPMPLYILNIPDEMGSCRPEHMKYLKSYSDSYFRTNPGRQDMLISFQQAFGTGRLFRFVYFVGAQEAFIAMVSQTDALSALYQEFREWISDPKNQSYIQSCIASLDSLGECEPVTVNLAEEEIESSSVDPLLSDPRLKYIDVHHPLVTSGNQTQSMGYSPVDEDRNLETGPNKGDDFQDRTRGLLKVLIGDAQSGVQKITVRWDRRNANDDNIEGRPYNLIDIEMQDGSRSRVVVCDYKGHMTYVERNASELKDQETLQISALRANRKVWTAVHVNDKQWCERIQEVLYTPLDLLTPELKSRSYWHGLKGVLTETFAATVMATGNLPGAADDRIVEYGPLAGRTTYSRMYNAANRGAVAGLDKGTTYKKLFAELTSGPMPELIQFISRAPLQAKDILKAWNDIKAGLGEEATVNDYADLVEVDGRNSRAIDLAFKFNVVQGFDIIPGFEQHRPSSLRAFLRGAENQTPISLAA